MSLVDIGKSIPAQGGHMQRPWGRKEPDVCEGHRKDKVPRREKGMGEWLEVRVSKQTGALHVPPTGWASPWILFSVRW